MDNIKMNVKDLTKVAILNKKVHVAHYDVIIKHCAQMDKTKYDALASTAAAQSEAEPDAQPAAQPDTEPSAQPDAQAAAQGHTHMGS